MSDEESSSQSEPPGKSTDGESQRAPSPKRELLPLPGLAAISLYLLLLAMVIIVGAVGGHYPLLFLVLPVFLFAACGGLLMLFRWAWAMALAAVLLLGGYNLWLFARIPPSQMHPKFNSLPPVPPMSSETPKGLFHPHPGVLVDAYHKAASTSCKNLKCLRSDTKKR